MEALFSAACHGRLLDLQRFHEVCWMEKISEYFKTKKRDYSRHKRVLSHENHTLWLVLIPS